MYGGNYCLQECIRDGLCWPQAIEELQDRGAVGLGKMVEMFCYDGAGATGVSWFHGAKGSVEVIKGNWREVIIMRTAWYDV